MAAISLLLRSDRLVLRLEAHLDRIDITAGINIGLRDIIGSLGTAILPVLRAWEVLLGPRTGSRPCDLTLNAKNVVAHLHTDISLVALSANTLPLALEVRIGVLLGVVLSLPFWVT